MKENKQGKQKHSHQRASLQLLQETCITKYTKEQGSQAFPSKEILGVNSLQPYGNRSLIPGHHMPESIGNYREL